MNILQIKLGKERQCHDNKKKSVCSFSFYIRIIQSSKVKFTVFGLTNPDVNLNCIMSYM